MALRLTCRPTRLNTLHIANNDEDNMTDTTILQTTRMSLSLKSVALSGVPAGNTACVPWEKR